MSTSGMHRRPSEGRHLVYVGSGYCFVCYVKCFFVLPPVCCCECFHDVNCLLSFLCGVLYVFRVG